MNPGRDVAPAEIGSATARFDDLRAGRAWVFGPPDRVLSAHTVAAVPDVLRAVDRATAAGAWAWGYVGYEAAPAFDPALRVRPATPGDPLASFAICAPPAEEPPVAQPAAGTAAGQWEWDVDAETFAGRVEEVRRAIAAGRVYQVNLTARLFGRDFADPLALYARLAHAQHGAYNAYLDFGDHVTISASPELFFQWDASGITTRPMKGTASRGRDGPADERIRAELRASAKQQAENIMIVDVLRNDLSRIARPGSVRVSALLQAERYVTVWQLTSTVTAEPRAAVGLPDVFGALFPCGSVTGAPKPAATELIADLETSPRGVYCGAVGMVAPPGSEFRARFSVPIRTATVDRARRRGVYGTGGGITYGSDPADEFREMAHKADILGRAPAGSFDLLETMRCEPDGELRNLDRHLARLVRTADYFDVPLDIAALRARLSELGNDAVAAAADRPRRVRLLVSTDGTARWEIASLDTPSSATRGPVTLAVDAAPTPASCWTVHKTTRRDHYRAATARHPRADDVILVNEAGDLTETTRATLAVRFGRDAGGRWCTPPLSSGCLPGVERQRLVDAGQLTEHDLTPADLDRADGLAVVSSLRGWRPARLLQPPA